MKNRDANGRFLKGMVASKTAFKKDNIPWNKGTKGVMVAWNKGKRLSEETKRKLSLLMKGRKPSKETIKKMIATKKRNGYKPSEETKRKIGVSNSKYHPTEERKKEISKWMTGRYAKEKHPNWKGGISKDVHSTSEPKYKKWRLGIFTRDDWTCKTCGARGVALEAHHIKSWAEYPELRYVSDNGDTLCKECHKLTLSYRGRNTKKRRAMLRSEI